MTDFTNWDSVTHSLIDPTTDWNSLLDHGLVKATDYILYLSGSDYRVVHGTTGKIIYSGSVYATVKNSATGSLTGTIADRVLGTIEGYASGVQRSVSDANVNLALPASYIIWSGSGIYWAKNGSTGKIDYSGSVAATVIQNVLTSGLTSGRTWKEKIVLNGNFTISETIFVPDYVIIEHFGNITIPDNRVLANTGHCIFQVGANYAGKHDFEIYLDQVNMNAPTQTKLDGTYQYNAIGIYDSYRYKVGIKYCYNGLLTGTATGNINGEVIGINIGNTSLLGQQGEISYINANNMQMGSIYLNNVQDLTIYLGNLSNQDDAVLMLSSKDVTIIGGTISGSVDGGLLIDGSYNIMVLGTRFRNNYAATTLGNIITVHSSALSIGPDNASEVFIVGCSIVNGVSGLSGTGNIPLGLGVRTGNVVHFTDCHFESDSSGWLSAGTNAGKAFFSNCHFKNFGQLLNWNSSAGTQISIEGGTFVNVTDPKSSYPQHVNDRLYINHVLGYQDEDNIYKSDANYIIYSGSGIYWAKNGTTGVIDYSGSNASTVIQSTLTSGLTASRTWKETVALRGNISLSNAIAIPSYTTLNLSESKLTLTFSTGSETYTEGAFYNSGKASGNTDIEIIGGKIDNNNICYRLLSLTNVDRFKISGVHFYQSKSIASGSIDVRSQNGVIENNIFENTWILNVIDQAKYVKVCNNSMINTYDSGVSLGSAATYPVKNIVVRDNSMYLTGSTEGFGVDVFGDIENVVVEGNWVSGSAYNGIYVQPDGASLLFPRHVRISSNTVICPRNSRSCITTEGNVAAGNVHDVVIENNYCFAPLVEPCIYIHPSKSIKVIGNTCDGNGADIAGISCTADGGNIEDVMIHQNRVSNVSYGLHFLLIGATTISDVDASWNNLSGSATGSLVDGSIPSANIRFFKNRNYVTEKSGLSNINSPSGSFAHGLASPPTYVSFMASGSTPTQFSWTHSGSAGVWVYHDAGGVIPVNWKVEA